MISLSKTEDKDTKYRKGFWSEGRERWDTNPKALGLHDETALTRRQKAQEELFPSGSDLLYSATSLTQPAFERLVAKRALQVEKRKARREAAKAAADH